ncbi:uncharacterized protein ISCGN_017977, partial [Ixodes scapularis]
MGGQMLAELHPQESQEESTGELIQLICAGCLNGFESEDLFAAHVCTGHQGQGQDQAFVTADDSVINMVTGAGTLTSADLDGGHLVATTEDGITTTVAINPQEDLATQLARAVAEATGPGQVTVSINTADGIATISQDPRDLSEFQGVEGLESTTDLELADQHQMAMEVLPQEAMDMGNNEQSEELVIQQLGEMPEQQMQQQEQENLQEQELQGHQQQPEEQQMECTTTEEQTSQEVAMQTSEMTERTAQLLMAAAANNPEGLDHLAVESEDGEVIHFAIVRHGEEGEGDQMVQMVTMGSVAAGDQSASYMLSSGDMTTTSAQLGSETKVVGALNREAPLLSVGGDLCVTESVGPNKGDEMGEYAEVAHQEESAEGLQQQEAAEDPQQQETTEEAQQEPVSVNEAVARALQGEEEAITGMAFATGEGDGDQMPIMMMVPGGDHEGLQVVGEGGDGFANTALLKVPTSDGGERVLLIPISSDAGGNAVFQLPSGLSLAGGEQGEMRVVGDGEQGILTLPMDTVTGEDYVLNRDRIPAIHKCLYKMDEETRRDYEEQTGIKIQDGRFTYVEDEILRRNYRNIAKYYNLRHPHMLVGLQGEESREDCKAERAFMKEEGMLHLLGKGLEHRTLKHCYYRGRALFDPSRKVEKREAARLQIMERLHKVDDQLDVYYRSMANSYQCIEAELSALLRDIEEQAARNVKAGAPKSKKKLKPKVKQEKRSSGPARRSSLRRTVRASASLTKKSSEPRKVKVEPVSPPSSDTDMGQENVDPRGGASDQTETAAVETITPVQAATPVAQTSSRLQGTPLMTRSQTRQLQNAQGNAQHTVPDSPKAPPSALPKAMRALQLGSPAKHTPTRMRQLFSPYAKCSVQEKARAFEQKLVKHVQPILTPSKGTPSKATPKATAVPTPVATPSTITRKALKRKSSSAEKRVMRSSTASQLEENEKQAAEDLSSTLTSGGEDDSDWQDSPVVKKFALPPSRPKVARGDPGAKAGKATSSKVLAVPKPGISSIQLVKPSTSEPGTGPPSRLNPEQPRKRLHSKSPDVARKRIPSNSSDSEQQRKQGLLKMKTEAMK